MFQPFTTLSGRVRRLGALVLAVCFTLAISTTIVYAAGLFDDIIDPLPDGCIRPTPPGEEAPLCCLSGFVYVDGNAVKDAEVTISDAQGVIGQTGTQRYQGKEQRPYYYVDLTRLTRPITPTNVITLAVNYHGLTIPPVRYTVQKGGQQFHFNLYTIQDVLPLIGVNLGAAELGKFQNISAVAVDSYGNLYLSDGGNFRIEVLSSAGVWLNRPHWQREIGVQPHQIRSAPTLAIDRQRERVYLADPYKVGIAIYTTDGDFTGKSIPAPSNTWSLAVDGAGNVYAMTSYAGLYKFGPDGSLLKHLTEAELVQYIGGKPNQSTGDGIITVSPQGDLFVARRIPNGIFKFTSDLVPVPFLVDSITEPTAILSDDTNNLFVFDHAAFQLYALDANGKRLNRSWPVPPFSRGSGLYLAAHGDSIYLVSGYDGKIMQYPIQGGNSQNTWGGFITNDGSIEKPADIAVGPDQSLFMVDPWSARINQVVDNQIVHSWQVLGQPGGYNSAALTFDANGKLIATVNGSYLQRFRLEGANLITETLPWGGPGAELGKFSGPTGLAAAKNGFVFVADSGNHRIDVLYEDPITNNFVTVTSSAALTVTGVLSQPFGIAVDDRNTPIKVYVTDPATSRIVKLTFDGQQLHFEGTIGSFGAGAGQFYGPRHLTVVADGTLWVADDYYRVHHLDPNDLKNWHTYGNFGDPAWNAYGLAVAKTANQKDLIYISSWIFGLVSSFKPLETSDPVATIVHCGPGDLVPGETLTCVGAGQDGDATNIIAAYEWTTASGLSMTIATPQVAIPTIAGATTASQLGAGLHILWLRVQDDEGTWSQPISTTIYVAPQVPVPQPTGLPPVDPSQPPPTPPVTCPAGHLWTLLLYLDADNKNDGAQLLAEYQQALQRLEQLNHACVQVAVQMDGPASIGNPTVSDTQRWLIHFNADGTLPVTTTLAIAEQQMDAPEALSDFIQWGQHALPADHYYLAIADHGNAFQGIAFDHTTDATGSAYLSAGDLYAALTTPGVLPIDIVHLDACSMALLDVAYELHGQVDYLIASQYIGWGFFAYADYASYITQWTDEKQLAELIVNRYAILAEQNHLPYTLSALNLLRVDPVKNGIDRLAMYLKAWLNADLHAGERHKQLFDILRNQSQFFDSNSNYLNTPRDAYIDLKEFVERIQQAALTADITAAAADILTEFNRADGLLLLDRHSLKANLPHQYANGAQIDLTKANGISLYYPAEGTDLLSLPVDPPAGNAVAASTPYSYTQIYADYLANQLFDFTRAARWGEFLQAAYGAPADGQPLELPPDPLVPPPPPSSQLYLPVVMKK